MKRLFTLLLLTTLFFSHAYAANKSMRAYLSYSTFSVPDKTPYIETYLAVDAKSVMYKETSPGNFMASLEIIMIFSQDDSIRDFAKYELNSPVIQDTMNISFGFIDQQRFSLPDGEYQLSLSIADLNNPKVPPFKTIETIDISFPADAISLSGIQLVEQYDKTDKVSALTKSGYNLIPMVYAFYPESSKVLTFYAEVYNTNKVFGADGKYLLNYFITSYETNNQLQDFLFRKRMDAKEVNVVFNAIDISMLPSGNYFLTLEVRDRENKVVAENKVFFQRSNPSQQYKLNDLSALNITNTFASRLNNGDTLREYIRCLEPISSEAERDYANNLILTEDMPTMQRYFYNFWLNRSSASPESAWQNYYMEVRKVNAAYKTPTKKGYATDRGRVYLKYGPPNHITESYNEPGAYPYEIWQYYTLENQRNKRFVFYTKDMVTNDFSLIHSDAFGELSNYRWQLDIYKRTWDPNSIDATSPPDAFGNRATDFYRNPR